jgi:hypothetical protein
MSTESTRYEQYKVLRSGKIKITCKQPNNCVFLKNGEIFVVENIVIIAGRKKIIGYNYINKRRLFEEPRDAAGVLQAYNVSDVSDTVVNDVEDILCKAFRLKIFSNTEDDGSPNSDNEYDPPSFAIYPLLSNDKLC